MRWMFTLRQESAQHSGSRSIFLSHSRETKCIEQTKYSLSNGTNMGNYFTLYKFHNHCNLSQNHSFTHFKSRKLTYFHFQKGLMCYIICDIESQENVPDSLLYCIWTNTRLSQGEWSKILHLIYENEMHLAEQQSIEI